MNNALLTDTIQNGALIAAVIFYIFNEVRKEVGNRRSTRKSLDKNVFIDARIYPILWELLSQYGCARVYLTQFHNGDNFYTGQSIQRMTISHEVAKKGVTKVKTTHENVLINEFNHRVLMNLQRSNTFHSTIDDSDGDLNEWMKVYDVGTMLEVRIIDGHRKETVAVLNLHWQEIKRVGELKLFEIQELNKKFEKIFDEL